MERWKAVLKKMLWPGRGWVCFIVLWGGISLALTFLIFGDSSPFAYASYLLSAYGQIVLVAAIAPLFSRTKRLIHHVPLAHRYLSDRYFKVRSGLLLSLFINLCYAGFKMTCAVLYTSIWDGALAVYHILLCAVRIYLIRRVPADGQNLEQDRELRCYRTTGMFLFVMDLALSVIATQIVMDGYSYDYPGTLIYVVALHAFYSLTIAIANTVRFRRFNSLVLSAAKAVNLTTALVSIFNLETAMIAQFGADQVSFRFTMIACTAFGVCVIVLGITIFMVFSANQKLRRLSL